MALSERHEALTVDPEVSTLGATPTEAAIPAKHDSTISPCVGVDGCGAGWLAVAKEGGVWSYRLHTQLADVVAKWPGSSQILVDRAFAISAVFIRARGASVMASRIIPRFAPYPWRP